MLFISISIKIGIKAMDYIAYLLGLNINGIPLSQQTLQDAINNISSLTDKLTNPEYIKKLKLYVETITNELEPIIKDFIDNLIDHIIQIIQKNEPRITSIIKDGLLDIPVAGLFISAADITTKFVEIVNDFIIHGTELTKSTSQNYNKLKKLNDIKFPSQIGGNIHKRIIDSIYNFHNINKI